jgi:formamidopyrimidine-DNA glycosylase
VPELPEVETMRRIVERELSGRTLASVEVRLPKLLRESPMPDLGALVGRQVVGARRRAKVLAIDWSGDLTLLAHFKLAGQLAVFLPDGVRHVAGHPVPAPDGDYPHKATHVIFRFADGATLYHSDIRQFGWLRLMPTEEANRALEAFGFADEGVGPEMIAADALRARLNRRRIPIKQALLDQTVVAGLGNIYVDEALHHARIYPTRPANALSDDEFARLYAAIPWALERGIEQGGARIVHGRAYPVDGFPAVHGREGESCFRCGATIVKTRVGGRGTYFCPICQPEPSAG